MRSAALILIAAVVLPGCFWGDSEAKLFFQVTGANYEQYEDLLYPEERADAWADIYAGRASVCVDGDEDEGCAGGTWERSDIVDLYVPYETSRARGLITQKGDLQITAHLDVGEAWGALAEDDFDDLAYLEDTGQIYGVDGSGCGPDLDLNDRNGVGRCIKSELSDNAADYGKLDEDLRLVMVVNLPGEDDIRSTACQDRPTEFASDDWDYPRTLRVNYNAAVPVGEDDEQIYGDPEEDPPLPQCDIEVFATLRLGLQTFSADYYGQGDEEGRFTLDRVNDPCVEASDGDCADAILGTLELESLTLPGEDGTATAAGRFRLGFTSDQFSARDGSMEAIGRFDVEVRVDRQEIDEPERQTDLESAEQ